MRDLVIWAVALRIARRDGRALLVSRDEVHSHERGEAEAAAQGLLRAKSMDEALVLLGRESPAGALASSLLAAVWNDLREAELPLPPKPLSARVTDLEFVTDDEGRISGSFRFSLDVPEGLLSATAKIHQVSSDQVQADLHDVTLGQSPWKSGTLTVVARGELPKSVQKAKDRLDDLKRALEGQP